MCGLFCVVLLRNGSMCVSSWDKMNKKEILQRAADLANGHTREPTISISGIGFVGNGKARSALGLAPGFSGTLELSDVGTSGVQHGVYVHDDPLNQLGVVRRVPMKINVDEGSKIDGGHAGVSVPNGSSAEINVKGASTISGGVIGVEERDAAVRELQAVLPAGTPSDAIVDALNAVKGAKDGSQEDMEKAVRASRLWEWIKEYGPDLIGLVVKTGAALAN